MIHVINISDKMKTPRTLEKDYLEFDTEVKDLARKATIQDMSVEQYQSELKEIERRYEGRVFPEDTCLFEKYSDFERFGMNQGINFYMVMWSSIEHEREHGRIAQELGYTVTFGYSFFIVPAHGLGCKTFIRTKEIKMPTEHARMIAQAPQKLSAGDKSLINLINMAEFKDKH